MLGVNEDVVQIYNDKDVKLLSKDLVDISLEACLCIRQLEK